MTKVTNWIVVVIGVLLLLPLLGVTQLVVLSNWLIALGVLAVGILKLLAAKK